MADTSFFQKRITDLTYGDVNQLVREQIPESVILDYKSENYKDSSELAKDVAAFANTQGGYIILGVQERLIDGKNSGLPEKICGIADDPNLRKRLGDMILNSMSPTPAINISQPLKEKEDSENCVIVIIHVPKSFDSLHMVMVKGKYQFRYYKRYDNQNVPMDESEVRMRYERMGQNIEHIDIKLTDVCEQTLSELSKKYEGGLAVALVPLFSSQKFDKREIAETFDIQGNNYLRISADSWPSIKMRMEYFEHTIPREESIVVLRLYYDGPVCFVAGDVFHETNNQRVLNAGKVVQRMYHLLQFFSDYYLKYQYHGYLRLLIRITKLAGSQLVFPEITKHYRIDSIPKFEREFPNFTRTIELSTIAHNTKEIVEDCVLPLFRESGFNKLVNCWDDNSEPYYDKWR